MKNPRPLRRKGFCYHVFTKLRNPCVVYNGPGVTHVVRPGGLMHTRVYHFSCPGALFMHNS
jgi:hypothetical protein